MVMGDGNTGFRRKISRYDILLFFRPFCVIYSSKLETMEDFSYFIGENERSIIHEKTVDFPSIRLAFILLCDTKILLTFYQSWRVLGSVSFPCSRHTTAAAAALHMVPLRV